MYLTREDYIIDIMVGKKEFIKSTMHHRSFFVALSFFLLLIPLPLSPFSAFC